MSARSATPEQIQATRPDQSCWVSANAGSGKTHVLTERVAHLLLSGADPQRILCLTYTKAAANEMQTRLFRLLGEWAMLDDEGLAARLAHLSGQSNPETDPDMLARARRLFAKALETPGGLKIQTIHAFCETLLRRFPLEAGVSPRFEISDDRESGRLLHEVRAEMAEDAETGRDAAFDRAAALLTEDGIEALTGAILSERQAFRISDADDRLAVIFGDVAGMDEPQIARAAMESLRPERLSALIGVLAKKGGQIEQSLAQLISDWVHAMQPDPLSAAGDLMAALLTKDGDPRKQGIATKAVQAARPQAVDEFAELTGWAIETRNRLRACKMARRTQNLYAFAQPLVGRFDSAKTSAGALDFNDLINRVHMLLTRSDMRSWVLYKLDHGIDHILVDEAQDTSPEQWRVIASVAEEFLSDAGARAEARSLFVVGDEKQSIYSFQGAEPHAFGEMRGQFAERLAGIGSPLGQPDLLTSFRSAPAILQFVDAVFAAEAAHGLTIDGLPPVHEAFRALDHGRVELWPPVERDESPKDHEWWKPIDSLPPNNAKQRLAEHIAREIDRMIGREPLPARAGKLRRLVRAEDILVLVTRRYPLAQSIIRALKKRGIPVAGADRLSLSKELAVKDLLALAKVALLPSDDLSLAALLRSPLCGVSEDELFDLAHRRDGALWQAVHGAEKHAETARFLGDMADVADYLRPYEFFERALVRHDGRRRLMARLGAEAEDPIDELLNQALAHERREIPTLSGFIAWVEAGGIEVKREMDHGENKVRVMTVHGAKGLEAPIVILPDTTTTVSDSGSRPQLLPVEPRGNRPEPMIWAGAKGDDDPVTAAARAQRRAREEAERKRLLYVALTRAEDWLILCGAQSGKQTSATWYDMLAAGMERVGATQVLPSPTGMGEMTRFERGRAPLEPVQDLEAPSEKAARGLPDWTAPSPPERRVGRRSPSALVPHDVAGGTGIGRQAAMLKGTAIHALLERLPDRVRESWPELAPRILESVVPELDPAEYPGIIAEAAGALSLPEISAFFGPQSLAEAAVSIDDRPELPRMIGRIDRLLIGDDSIAILDFKSDADVPADPDSMPESYLVQLGTYQSAIAASWPNRSIDLAVLWTSVPRLMDVPAEMAADALARRLGSS